MDGVIVYRLEICPNCELLKAYLDEQGVAYGEEEMSSAAALTELRLNGVFASEAPVLRKGDAFLTSAELFRGGAVDPSAVGALLDGA